MAYADGINVRLVPGEGLSAHSFSDVPELGGSVTRPGHKQPRVGRKRQAHDIASVAGERGRLHARLNVPESTEGRRGREKNKKFEAFGVTVFPPYSWDAFRYSPLRLTSILTNSVELAYPLNEHGKGEAGRHSSHTHHEVSPELVTILVSSTKRQQDK